MPPDATAPDLSLPLSEWASESRAPREVWAEATQRAKLRQTRETAEIDDERAPHQHRVNVLADVAKELQKEAAAGNDPSVATAAADAAAELEQAQKDLHLPLKAGWLVRMLHGGALLGMQDVFIEKLAAELRLSLQPGRWASGAQQAASIHVSFDASCGDEDGATLGVADGGGDADADGADASSACGVVLRCERVTLVKLQERLFFPKLVQASSLTIALRLNGQLSFAFGSDGEWVRPPPPPPHRRDRVERRSRWLASRSRLCCRCARSGGWTWCRSRRRRRR